jgi:NMD protein affecting ribosome stability and mRNA decay
MVFSKGKIPRNIGKSKASLPKPAPSQRKKERARPDLPGIEMCRNCGAIFWHKAWRESLNAIPDIPSDTKIIHKICPACRQEEEGLFEGEVIIEGIPSKFFDEILRLIERIGEERRERDPMSRILTFQASRSSGRIRLTLSENQLARLISRKVREAFGGKAELKFSKEESTLRVRVDLSSRK